MGAGNETLPEKGGDSENRLPDGAGIREWFKERRHRERGCAPGETAVRSCRPRRGAGLRFFNIRIAGGTVRGISHGHCSMVRRGDGDGYGPDRFLKNEKETMHGTGDVAFLPAAKGGVSCELNR